MDKYASGVWVRNHLFRSSVSFQRLDTPVVLVHVVLYLDNSSPLTPVGDIPNVGDTHVPPGRVVITQGSQQGSELHAYFVPAVNVRRLQANSH